MLSWDSFLLFKELPTKRSSKLLLALSLAVSCVWWTGCNSVPQSFASVSSANQSTSSQQTLSLPSSLSDAHLGSGYQTVLSVSGGQAPYRFSVNQGELPPGLILNGSTGSISGTPTQAGGFGFTITVSGGLAGSSGSHAYLLTVSPCAECVTVSVSPASPSVGVGGKLQFSALVTNTSNTAVTWTANAGTISAAGLFTAPAKAPIEPITVRAMSVAKSAAYASATVTITSGGFTITTSSLPPAVMSAPYSASLTASGGQPPYQWSIVSGSLPAGLSLGSGTGMLSGSTNQTGTFTFGVQGTDAAAHTAQHSFSVVSTLATTCGPPTYGCSRTDMSIVQLPSSPPKVGGLLGANSIVTDPDFGNRIIRITDANTNPALQNRTFVTTSSGSADDNLWNIDSTLFIVQDSGGNGFPFTFDPATLQAARMYVSSFPETSGMKLESGNWSRVNPNLLYTHLGTAINKYDFTDRSTPPNPQLVYDFTSSRNCLPAGFKETWTSKGGVSAEDAVFGMAYSNAGDQGTGVYVVAYKVGSGCTMLNTKTGEVTGDWGSKGTINIPDRWVIHNAKISKDGNWMIIARDRCTSSSCSTAPYFWQIGTTNVSDCGEGQMCSGHWTEGYTHWVNNDNSPMSNQVIRSFYQAASPHNLTDNFPPNITVPFDQHQSWNNADPADSVPFLSSTCSSTTPFPAPWYNEIIAVASDGSGKTWRFAHSFITSHSQRFSTEYAIGTVSQDGRFFIFSSDWMGQLGSESGTRACTIGKDCRGDVFVVELK